MNPTTAPTTAAVTLRKAPLTMFRNVSDFLYAMMMPATSAAIAMITSAIGFADMTMFRAACVAVYAFAAVDRVHSKHPGHAEDRHDGQDHAAPRLRQEVQDPQTHAPRSSVHHREQLGSEWSRSGSCTGPSRSAVRSAVVPVCAANCPCVEADCLLISARVACCFAAACAAGASLFPESSAVVLTWAWFSASLLIVDCFRVMP
jgi:hypothetical protein